MDGDVFIHVGIEKTGSTYLRSVICRNEKFLRTSGISYVRAGRESGHHYWLAKALGYKYKPITVDDIKERKAIEAIKIEISNSHTEKLLLSSEHFDFNLGAENSTRLIDLFEGRKVHVILVLRNQIDYSQSLYLEHLKWKGLHTYAEFMKATSRQHKYDFLHRYTVWKNAGTNVTVIDYDASRKRLLTEFFDTMGLSHLFSDLSIPTKDANVTPTIDLMEFIRLLNHAIPKQERRGNFDKIFKKVTKDMPELLRKRAFPLPQIAKEIFEAEQNNNQRLAKLLGVVETDFLGGSLLERLHSFDHLAEPNISTIVDYYFS